MDIRVIVPVKPLKDGKSRLDFIKNNKMRIAINLHLFLKTIFVLLKVTELKQIIVVSRDKKVREIAESYGVLALGEESGCGLNKAIDHGSIVAYKNGASHLMIVPTDLPLLTCDDIESLINQMDREPMVIIVPDQKMEGTNVLFLTPFNAIPFQFGYHSFKKHIKWTRNNRIPIKIIRRQNICLDLDTSQDYDVLKEINNNILKDILIGGLHA